MRTTEFAVVEHYSQPELLKRIEAGLQESGADLSNLKPSDLASVEEFHIGGRRATEHAVSTMGLLPAHHVLDIGCGIGGAARYIAATVGAHVTGIDLTPEYIEVATALSARVGLSDRLRFEVASALAMPLGNARFDAAITFHVAMNIADRAGLYAEIARVMKPGAVLCVYDVMKKSEADLTFPLPWASTPKTSFLLSPVNTVKLLRAAGFDVTSVEDRTDFAIDYFYKSTAAQKNGAPPLGIHLLMGDTAKTKFANALANLERGHVAPVQIIATRHKRSA